MSKPSEFEETFNEYHDLIRKEIAKDMALDIKVAKVEQLIYLMHSIVSDRFSKEYLVEADEIKNILKKGFYFDDENSKVSVSFASNNVTRKNRLDLVVKWLSLMLQEYAPFKLDGNLNKVDFG